MERKERRTIHSVPRGRRFHLDKRHSNRPERARDEEERSYARNVRDAVHRRGINNRGGPGMSGNHGQSRARACFSSCIIHDRVYEWRAISGGIARPCHPEAHYFHPRFYRNRKPTATRESRRSLLPSSSTTRPFPRELRKWHDSRWISLRLSISHTNIW